MDTVSRVAKNTFWLFFAQIINLVLSIILISFLARILLPIGYGKYSFAISFTAIFAIFTDLGLNTLLIREVARKKEDLSKYFKSIATLRVVLSIIIFVVLVIIINLMKYPQDTTLAVYIFGLAVIIGSFSGLFNAVFRSFEKMEYEAFANVLERMLIVVFALIVLVSGYGLIGVALVFLVAALLRLLLSFRIYLKKFPKVKSKTTVNAISWLSLLKTSIPFALTGIFTMLYLKIDTVMLSLMDGDAVVGWYNAAYNIVLFLSVIPGMFLASVFPVFSNYFVSSKEAFKRAYTLSFKYLLILALPMVVGMVLLSENIILLLFTSAYSPSIVVLRILAWIQIFAFLGWLLGVVFNSINEQKIFMYVAGSGVIINILLNLILIPKFSLNGAAIATLVTQIAVFSLLFYFTSKRDYSVNLMKILFKPVIAVLIMAIVVFLIRDLSLVITVPTGAIIYFLSLYLIGGISKEEKEIFLRIIGREYSPLVKSLNRELNDCDSVLDLGCGRQSILKYVDRKICSVGVDLHGPSIRESKKVKIHDKYLKADIRKVKIKKKSFDAVIAIDVLEHLTKKEGYSFIRRMESLARKKVILFTTNGFVPQEEYDDNDLQLHKSGWSSRELKETGFKVYGINGLKFLRGHKARVKFKPLFFWQKISDLSQKLVYNHPKFAFQLFCVKRLIKKV